MPTPSKTLIELEKKFWQAIVDQDTDGALELLSEPALHGERTRRDEVRPRRLSQDGGERTR